MIDNDQLVECECYGFSIVPDSSGVINTHREGNSIHILNKSQLPPPLIDFVKVNTSTIVLDMPERDCCYYKSIEPKDSFDRVSSIEH